MTLFVAFAAGQAVFFDDRVSQPPAGAVEITASAHANLLAGQADGKIIVADANGKPVLRNPTALPPPVPTVVSRFQARAALHRDGLLPAAEAAIADADPISQIAWADTIEWRRDSLTIAAIGGALGLTDAQIDDLFRNAATITA